MSYASHVAEYYRIKAGKAYDQDRGGLLYRLAWDQYLMYVRGGWV